MTLTLDLQKLMRELAVQAGKRTTTKLATSATSAAATTALLVHLRNFAAAQDGISRRDLRAVIEGWMEGAELTEHESDMGDITYTRKAATTKPATTTKAK